MSDCDNSLTRMDWLSSVNVKVSPAKTDALDSSLSLDRPSTSRDPFEDFSSIERETGKPSHSYSTLIKYAISSSKSKRMSLRQIYKWISDHFPYYKDARNGWKNSIRHNLSLNKCFIKVPRDKGDLGKGCYWSLREGVKPERPAVHSANDARELTPNESEVASIIQRDSVYHETPGVCSVPGYIGIPGIGVDSLDHGTGLQAQLPQQPMSAGPTSSLNCMPDLTDSTVRALVALIGSQSDQVLGAASAPPTATTKESLSMHQQGGPILSENQAQQHQQDPHQAQELPSACLTPPPPPLSPPSAVAADLNLSASLQTICRSLLGESSGSSGVGAFAPTLGIDAGSVAGGSSATSSSSAGVASCQQAVAPDLSASTLDFVQRMLPQLKDSFQLSESALHDLWDHCRSTSRPARGNSSAALLQGAVPGGTTDVGGGIPLPRPVAAPMIAQSSLHQPPLRPAMPPPVQPSRPSAPVDASQDVEDDFNWDSIL